MSSLKEKYKIDFDIDIKRELEIIIETINEASNKDIDPKKKEKIYENLEKRIEKIEKGFLVPAILAVDELKTMLKQI